MRRGDESDFPLLYQMYAETSVRDGFVIRSEAYYREVWHRFFSAGMMTPLIAEVEGMDRGGYAGPVGWLDGAGNADRRVRDRLRRQTGTELSRPERSRFRLRKLADARVAAGRA